MHFFAEVVGIGLSLLATIGHHLVGSRDPNTRRVEATAKAYRRWAAKHRFTPDPSRNGYRGTLALHDVVVSLGLQATPPLDVVIEINVRHGGGETAVLESLDDASTEIENALAVLSHQPAPARTLRSIALSNGTVCLRFAALTPPEVVERYAVQALQALEASAASIAARTAYR